MCDIEAGQLILCFARADDAARRLIEKIHEGEIEHVTHLASLDARLARLGLAPPEGFAYELHLVEVPAGQEAWKTTYLQFFYKHELLEALGQRRIPFDSDVLSSSQFHFTAVPNSLLGLCSPGIAPRPVKAADFQLGVAHGTYRTLLNISAAATGAGVKIHLLDSGLAPDATFPVTGKSFVDPNPIDFRDEHGHGTALAILIHDVAPQADLTIYKVTDANGRANEWDVLAAVAASGGANVLNLSLGFGLQDYTCPKCGRISMSSRSAVFENVLSQFGELGLPTVVTAAAGNRPLGDLVFPARFGDVVAISAVDSHLDLTSYSNHGTTDAAGDPHGNRFVLPGGETHPRTPESVGSFQPNGPDLWGTSYATAYASGVVAAVWSQHGVANTTPASLLQALKNRADLQFPAYQHSTCGNGLMRV